MFLVYLYQCNIKN